MLWRQANSWQIYPHMQSLRKGGIPPKLETLIANCKLFFSFNDETELLKSANPYAIPYLERGHVIAGVFMQSFF